MSVSLDSADISILNILQEDASLSIAEIAKRTGLSQTPCWRRIRKLKQEKIIKKISATIDNRAAGFNFIAYLMIRLVKQDKATFSQFERHISPSPNVTQLDQVMGSTNYVLKVVLPDIEAFNTFISDYIYSSSLIGDTQALITIKEINQPVSPPIG